MPRTQRSEQRVPQRGKFVMRTGANRFEISPADIPSDLDWAFKRFSIYGMEDTEGLNDCYANGWEPVSADAYPQYAGRLKRADNSIIKGGLMLMQRPKEISEDAREEDRYEAHNAVRSQVERLALSGHRQAGRGLKVDYRTAVPDDE